MANKKEINPKTGHRVAELIKSLNMTQTEFGDKIGLGSRQVSCIVTGKRRLTEDNARRIAELFPPVRYEWLLGWDDYSDNNSLMNAKLIYELEKISKDEIDFFDREFKAGKILECFGYRFHTMDTLENNRKEKNDRQLQKGIRFRKIYDLVIKDKNKSLYEFIPKDQAESIYKILKQAGEKQGFDKKNTSESQLIPNIEGTYDYMIEHERKGAHEWKSTAKDDYINNQRWFLCDDNDNICLEVSGETYERFFTELSDIFNALLMYHFPKLKETTDAQED